MTPHDRLQHQLADCARRAAIGGAVTVPEPGRLLWQFFVDLSATRTYHMAGPHAISHAEICAWARLHRWPLEPHHVAAIRAMDDAWLTATYAKGNKGEKPAPRSSGQAINPGAFDAVFG